MIHGSNPILLNVTYVRPTKSNDYDEYYDVTYKDGNEVYRSKEAPDADIYITKPEYRTHDYYKPQERIEKLDKVTVPISKIKRTIAEAMGEEGKRFYNNCRDNRDFRSMKRLYAWKYCYHCDYQPEYYFMRNWYNKYNAPNNIKITKGFLDIETDLIDYQVDLDNIPNTAYAPVNAVTVIMEDTSEVYTFILRPYQPTRLGRTEEEYQKRYKLYEKQKADHEYLMSHMSEFIDDLHNSFDAVYGVLKYHIREYEKEIDLITDVFRFINKRKPNFMEIWNMRFDIQYLYYRIIALNHQPSDIMCHPDFEEKRCSFSVDRGYKIEKQFDYFYCSSYTTYMCQMRMYGSIRKSEHKLRSLSLNYIANKELKDKKVEYPDEGNIVMFPYRNWMKFIKYNIKDVLLQKGIERKTNDCMTFYTRSHFNMTPYNKMFKETHLLRNVREVDFEKQGWVQGNNLNIIDVDDVDEAERLFYASQYDDDDEEDVSFKGAIVADPKWNARVGMKVAGIRTNNIFRNSIDFDMGAFYPSCKIASNMDPSTLLFKGSFDNNQFISGEYTNRSLYQVYYEKDKKGNVRKIDFTGEAVNTYVGGNLLTFGYNYLGLDSIAVLYKEVAKELK